MDEEAYVDRIRTERREKDRFFGSHARSPIPEGERDDFDGLRYFDPDPDYRFEVDLHEHDEKERITVETTHEGERDYLRWGEFRFAVDGEELSLQAYRRVEDGDPVGEAEGYWVPFRDATSGDETYGAGRYIDLDPAEDRADDGRWILDFNRAYNPFCAYSDAYECPLIPGDNWLSVPIEAGEKDWQA